MTAERSFFDLVMHHFGGLVDQYGFAASGGPLLARMTSDRHTLIFSLSGGAGAAGHAPAPAESFPAPAESYPAPAESYPALARIYAGRAGGLPVDAALIFAYLTRGVVPVRSAGSVPPRLYFDPSVPFDLRGLDSAAWQLERLADILRPMWPAVFVFLDQNGPALPDFQALAAGAGGSAGPRLEDIYQRPAGVLAARAKLEFAPRAEAAFGFLRAYGYKVTASDPAFVRFEGTARAGDLPPVGRIPASSEAKTIPRGAVGPAVYINVYHRLLTNQVGAHTGLVRPSAAEELNFDLEELAAWAGGTCSLPAARSPEEVSAALKSAARMFRKFAAPLLAGDTRLFQALLGRRIDAARWVSRAWAERSRGA